MTSVVVACKTISDELYNAMKIVEGDYAVRWVESGLHNFPDQLNAELQALLDELRGSKRVLMAFGCCGNSVIGLRTYDFELIIPRVDDCISLLVGSIERRVEINEEGGTYFLTQGWLRGERNIWVEYQYAIEKYGERVGTSVMKTMLNHYKYLALLDTKSFNIDEVLPEVEQIAIKLKLTPKVIPASVEYLCALLRGPWTNDRFVIVPPYSSLQDFPLTL